MADPAGEKTAAEHLHAGQGENIGRTVDAFVALGLAGTQQVGPKRRQDGQVLEWKTAGAEAW